MAVATKDKLVTLEALKAVNDRVKPISQGGTGATTEHAARVNLKIPVSLVLTGSTWSDIYGVLSEVRSGETCPVYCSASSASVFSGGAFSTYIKGLVSNLDNGTFHVFGVAGTGTSGGSLVTWSITNLTSASSTPTVSTPVHYYGGTDAAAAKAALGLGTSAQNVRFSAPSSSNQLCGLNFTVSNETSSLNGHSLMLVIQSGGIGLYDQTSGSSGWVWQMSSGS